MIEVLGQDYVSYINQKYQRCGGLWEGRYKGDIIESCRYILNIAGDDLILMPL